uniref:protein lin-54 homolog n=1 Tax=Styela clava TaxID=7725 RepID=UPI00193A4B30|nr:protein lin-54 homolog [Styela clava]
MESLKNQPDLQDIFQMEANDIVTEGTKNAMSPERNQHNSDNMTKIITPAKVLMVGEPVMVKTEQNDEKQQENSINDPNTNTAEVSGSSNEELADGLHTPSPETAAAMESFLADDDLSSASPKLEEKLPTPVNFINTNANKIVTKPQTSIMASIRTQQPISLAGKKFMVATQPIQVVRKDGGGGPVVTKFIVKKSNTSTAASSKTPVVFTKAKNIQASPVKTLNLQSGSIVLSPIKGGFKIPISPVKSPIKVSVIPPSNSQKSISTGKSFTIPIQTSISNQFQHMTQAVVNNNSLPMVNGIGGQINKAFVGQQQITIPIQNKIINVNSNQSQIKYNGNNNRPNQLVQRINVVPNSTTMQDSQGMKIQYVQLVPPNNNNNAQQPTIRSNQGQPITFTSMAQLNGGNLTLNQSPGGALTFIQSNLPKLQQTSNTQRVAQTVKVAIPSQTTHQAKPQQRLIMPATTLQPIRPNFSALPPGSVLTPSNVGYAMVPAKYVEQLTKQLNSQASFVQDTSIQQLQKGMAGKVGNNGKLKKPCNCTKSQCLKLYCECFANGQFCDECNCINCSNNLEHESERSKAVKQCLERNPAAFRPKIGRGKDDNRTHQKGCNCKRSGCLKNYCECYEARIPCTSKCKCIGCKNYEETNDRRSLMSLADAAEVRVQQQTAAKTKLSNQIGDVRPTARTTSSGERLPYTFFTQEVIEATCTCLLAQAEEAEKTNRPMVVAETMILEEFGRCVMQIIQSAGKAKVINLH